MTRPTNLGKIKWPNDDENDFSQPTLTNISTGVHWKTNGYLAIIILKYLQEFKARVPVIPYYGYTHNPYGFTFNEAITKMSDDEAISIWDEAIDKVIFDFEQLADFLWALDEVDEDLSVAQRNEMLLIKQTNLIQKAFRGLADIFADLEW